jgi:hypothetical protein
VVGPLSHFPRTKKKEKKQKLRTCNTTITHKALGIYSLPHFSHKKTQKAQSLQHQHHHPLFVV